jgi:hypothetical protein
MGSNGFETKVNSVVLMGLKDGESRGFCWFEKSLIQWFLLAFEW